ncbi:MAG: TrbC/VirB2 family protein [Neisseria animaloris]|nr:TrbC/VirB2 family protein [Neisseria animaloris]
MLKQVTKFSSLILAALASANVHAAGVGSKIKNAIDSIGGELQIAGFGLLFVGIVIAALNMFFNAGIGKKWLIGALGGGVLLAFARDIASFFASFGGAGGF